MKQTFEVWEIRGKAYQAWSLQPGLQEPASLALALAAGTGISGGTAATVPGMLMGRVSAGLVQPWALLEDTRVSGREEVEGVACWRIDGHRRGANLAVWLGVDDHLIRRLDETQNLNDFRMVSETTHRPRMNPPAEGLRIPPLP